jgi:hypothetical protein
LLAKFIIRESTILLKKIIPKKAIKGEKSIPHLFPRGSNILMGDRMGSVAL